jgi:hypothetical protein
VRGGAGPGRQAARAARGRRSAKLIKVYIWFAHWCVGARKGLLTVHIQFANIGEKFALLPKKFASEITKQQKKFTLMQKKFTLLQKKFAFLKLKFVKSLHHLSKTIFFC